MIHGWLLIEGMMYSLGQFSETVRPKPSCCDYRGHKFEYSRKHLSIWQSKNINQQHSPPAMRQDQTKDSLEVAVLHRETCQNDRLTPAGTGHSSVRPLDCSVNRHTCSMITRLSPSSLSCWLRGPAVQHWSLADVLSLSCAWLVADGWPLMWVSHPL